MVDGARIGIPRNSYVAAASGGPGDACDRGGRVFEVERVNHMYGREGVPHGWRGCPEHTHRVGTGCAVVSGGAERRILRTDFDLITGEFDLLTYNWWLYLL